MNLSLPHILIFLLVVVLLFGAGRISGVMGDMGKGIKSFKKGLAEDEEERAAAAAAKPTPRITDDRPAGDRPASERAASETGTTTDREQA